MNNRLSRLAGVSLASGALAAGALAVMIMVSGGLLSQSPITIAAHWASAPAALLVLFGLPALTVRLSEKAPILSVLGSIWLAIAVLVYDFTFGIIDAIVLPYLVTKHLDITQAPPSMVVVLFAGGFGVILGGILLGLAVLRSGAAPRTAGWLMLAGGVLMAAGLAPLPEGIDTVAEVSLMSGLLISGLQIAGVRAPSAFKKKVPAPA